MKFDMHCHTKEGSVDAKVPVLEYAAILSYLGYAGMLVADHNSYKGHDAWLTQREYFNQGKEEPFVVLRGIEYDTKDAGHILVVLPDEDTDRSLEKRGMKLDDLVSFVHSHGGICGPAHPYGTGFFALRHTKRGRFDRRICEKFDFVEGLNACSKPVQNRLNLSFARQSGLPVTCGSDAHEIPVIGTAYTRWDRRITCNNDLIAAVKAGAKTRLALPGALALYKEPNKLLEELGIMGYWIWNKALAGYQNLMRRLRISKK